MNMPDDPDDNVTKFQGLRVRLAIALGTAGVIALGLMLISRAHGHVNDVALASQAKGVTVVAARAARYRPFRRYVGTIQPWVEAKVGPQIIAAFVDTVLVRPGDSVKRGQVIATLDCRNASASSKAVAMQARALQTEQEALAHEAARVAELQAGGFASPNEIENRVASSASKQAELLQTQAKMQQATLEVNDCVLRSPFAGEISARMVDPGAFVRPGTAVVTVIDRTNVRVTGEVPEGDFSVVGPGTPVHIHALAISRDFSVHISRRSPSADLATRTVHLEIDVPDPARVLPVGTTAEMTIEVGEPERTTEIPLIAASVRGPKATVFVIDGQSARKNVYSVKGERGGSLFLDASLPAGAHVVTEGRALLQDGDRVDAKLEASENTAGTTPLAAGAKQ